MRRSFAVSAVLASVLAGCATLPPARAVADVKSLAGEWVGTLTGRFWASSLAMVINEDGTYVMVRSGGRPTAGTLSVSRGRLVFGGDDGRTGTLSLHEGDGRRVLRGSRDDGTATFEIESYP